MFNSLETQVSMTSLQIAELCGKEHKNVLQDIDNILIDLYPDETQRNSRVLKFQTQYENQTGNGGTRKYRMFNLDKHHTLCVVGKYSALLRIKMSEYIDALEAKLKESQKPKTNLEWARLFVESEESRLKAEASDKANKKNIDSLNSEKEALIGINEVQNETLSVIKEVVNSNTLFAKSKVTSDTEIAYATDVVICNKSPYSLVVSKIMLHYVGHPQRQVNNRFYKTSFELENLAESFIDAYFKGLDDLDEDEYRICFTDKQMTIFNHPAMGGRSLVISKKKAIEFGFASEEQFV